MILRGSVAVAVAAVVSIRGALISSLPNILLPIVRLSIRDLAFSGMKSWERTPLSVVVSRVESIVDVLRTLLLRCIFEIHFNLIPGVPPPHDGPWGMGIRSP